jgi:hypothetical protein
MMKTLILGYLVFFCCVFTVGVPLPAAMVLAVAVEISALMLKH